MKRRVRRPFKKATQRLQAVVANRQGEIFDLQDYLAVGMEGDAARPLTVHESVPLPSGSELMRLPDRLPLVMERTSGRLVTLEENPYLPGQPVYPVAAFNSPGYVVCRTCAYQESPAAAYLPLFSYGAVGWHPNGFRSAAFLVDPEPRQDLRQMPLARVKTGVRRMAEQLAGNRLCHHLSTCALTYGCPAAKNFFLGRFEAPLPTSRTCNARCLGCISHNLHQQIPNSQERIAFIPTAKEIAQVALSHIARVPQAVVSFGQGCEGDPLLAAQVIEPAIGLIRRRTGQGTINMNTNGSLPKVMQRLFAAGLDSVRISMNSLRRECYNAYFRPQGYRFEAVLESIAAALENGVHVAINYLNCPGFTDTPEEVQALTCFIEDHPIQMIQWRNLNFDPLRYLQMMHKAAPFGPALGMPRLLAQLRERFAHLRHGYFNPPKERFGPHVAGGSIHRGS
jgi:pyruvate-formate lyase-activating enzyme